MNKLASRALRLSGRVVAWIQAIVGCLMVAGALADLYMLLIAGTRPGDPTYLDELAPTIHEATAALLCGVALIALASAAPSLLRVLRRRVRRARPAG